MQDIQINPNEKRITEDITTLSTFVDTNFQGWTRRPFTSFYQEGRQWLKTRMDECGMSTRMDAAANLIGTIPGNEPELPILMIGSHTDTVTSGGRFDGIIGVLAGLEAARVLKESGNVLRHTLEVVDFTAEEPTEFGISTVGSRGMINRLSKDMLARTDTSGHTLFERLEMAEGKPSELGLQCRKKGDVAAYLELHIEQGPVLENNGCRLGVVTGIVGIHRYRVTVEGIPNHAGTTPMTMRADALTAASQMILELESLCSGEFTDPVVGTVGKMNVYPNASNVIPGRVEFEFEVRCLDTNIIENIVAGFGKKAQKVAEIRGVSINFDSLSKSEPIKISEMILDVVEKVCKTTASCMRLPSGAGHDANHIAAIAPIGMLFVPSKDGRSHCPEEWTSIGDIAAGVKALTLALIELDRIM